MGYQGQDEDSEAACRRCGAPDLEDCNCPDGDDFLIDGVGFADPGGESALRRATKDNPRNLPCRNCHAPDVLTPLDVAAGYQCDGCAVAREQDRDRDLVCGGSRKGCELCKNLEEE